MTRLMDALVTHAVVGRLLSMAVLGVVGAGCPDAGSPSGVQAGDVQAGDVVAGDVTAGPVTSEGDINAGSVTAGAVTATGGVTITGPMTANTPSGLGIEIEDVVVVIDTCNVGGSGPCPDAAGFETAVSSACVSTGTLQSFQTVVTPPPANQNGASGQLHLIAIVACD